MNLHFRIPSNKMIKRTLFFCILFQFLVTFICINRTHKGKEIQLTEDREARDKFELAVFSGNLRVYPRNRMWLDIIREKFLIPPSVEPYNLSNSEYNSRDNSAVEELHQILVNILVNKAPNNGETKFFVDCGANDGQFLSNTLPFELKYGWTGLLIEADPEPQKLLYQKHRKAWISNVCLSVTKYPNTVKMMRHKEWPALSFLPNNSIPHSWPEEFVPFTAKCIPIFSLLSALQITTVDYFSLDVKGAELSVLKTIPFDKIIIKVFSIEVQPKWGQELYMFMKNKGYFLHMVVRGSFVHDAVYIHKGYLLEMV